jgi:hypothetical protein
MVILHTTGIAQWEQPNKIIPLVYTQHVVQIEFDLASFNGVFSRRTLTRPARFEAISGKQIFQQRFPSVFFLTAI